MTCSDCKYYRVDPSNLKQGLCFRYPPTMSVVPQMTPGGVAMTKMSSYPPVTGTMEACGECAPKGITFPGKDDVHEN